MNSKQRRKTDSNGNEEGYSARKESFLQKYRDENTVDAAGYADWGRCGGEGLRAFVQAVGFQGGAVLLGYSRDKGAYRVIIMDDDDKLTKWIPCTADIDAEVWKLAMQMGWSKYMEVPDAPG